MDTDTLKQLRTGTYKLHSPINSYSMVLTTRLLDGLILNLPIFHKAFPPPVEDKYKVKRSPPAGDTILGNSILCDSNSHRFSI